MIGTRTYIGDNVREIFHNVNHFEQRSFPHEEHRGISQWN